jgi:hypothetical protein
MARIEIKARSTLRISERKQADLRKQGETLPADFQPLIALLQEVQTANYASAEQQVEHFERHLLNVEHIGPALDWAELSHAAGTAALIQKLIPADLWQEQDITPLLKELGALRG